MMDSAVLYIAFKYSDLTVSEIILSIKFNIDLENASTCISHIELHVHAKYQ